MSALVPLHHMASAVIVRTLMDHDDPHSQDCKSKAQSLISKLNTNLYTAVSKDLLDLFVDSYPRQLPAFLLPVLAPPHLRVLNLRQCCLIEEDSQAGFKYLKEALKSCSKLQSLVLDGCNLALPLLLCDVIIQHAPQLVSISVEECRGVSNEFVQKLLRGLPDLSHLNISICPEVTDNVFALSETQGLLEERDLKQASACGGCNLSSVDLSGNQQLTSTCIRHLTELCGPRLRNLNVAATRMDCTILWFLSGYSLSTAVQLAAEANKASMDDDSSNGETLAQLITEFRVLQERLKNLQEEECQRQEETGENGDKQEQETEQDTLNEDAKTTEEDETECGLQAGDQGHIKEGEAGCLEDARSLKEETVGNGLVEDGQMDNVCRVLEDERRERETMAQTCEELEGKMKDESCDPIKNKIKRGGVNSDMEEVQNAESGNPQAKKGCLFETDNKKEGVNQGGKVICKEEVDVLQEALKGSREESEITEEVLNQVLKDDQMLEPEDETREAKSARTGHGAVAGDSKLSVPDGEMKQIGKVGIEEGAIQQQQNKFKSSFQGDLFMDGSQDKLDAALGHFVNDIIVDCSRRLWHERVPQDCSCVHSPDLGQSRASGDDISHKNQIRLDGRTFSGDYAQNFESTLERTYSAVPEGSLCHPVQTASNVCKLMYTNSASSSDCVSSHPDVSANESPDSVPCVEYSTDRSSSSNQLLTADSSNDACKLKLSDSASESGCKRSQPARAASEKSDDSKATVCPWRRLYTPCITSLDMSIIDFDATLVVTCLKEFFVANTQLKKLTVCWKELTDSMLEIIASGGAELRSLCLVDCSSLTSFGVAHLLSKCRQLQQLDLQGVCYIADTALMPIFLQGNPCSLHSLKLSETNISDSTLTRIAKYLGKKITTLEISWCEEISDSGLAEIARHCTSLETLTLRQCSMSADTLMSLAWNCTGLVSLNMSGVENLTDVVAQTMMPSLRHLKKLDVSWNSELTDVAVSSVLSCCPLIVELYLMGLKRITEKPFMPIISELVRWQRCKNLIKLKMKERTLLKRLGEDQFSSDEEYEDLFSPVRSIIYAPCLRTLELQYCDRVNDDLLAELVAVCVGTLSIVDYYGMQIKPKLLKRDSSDI